MKAALLAAPALLGVQKILRLEGSRERLSVQSPTANNAMTLDNLKRDERIAPSSTPQWRPGVVAGVVAADMRTKRTPIGMWVTGEVQELIQIQFLRQLGPVLVRRTHQGHSAGPDIPSGSPANPAYCNPGDQGQCVLNRAHMTNSALSLVLPF